MPCMAKSGTSMHTLDIEKHTRVCAFKNLGHLKGVLGSQDIETAIYKESRPCSSPKRSGRNENKQETIKMCVCV